MSDRDERLLKLLEQGCKLDRAPRAELLDRTREEDSELGARLEALFAQLEKDGPLPRDPSRSSGPAQVLRGLTPTPSVAGQIDELTTYAGQESPYVVEEEVGRGAMGSVLKVFDKSLKRALAMKVIRRAPDTLDGPGSVALARFLEEAQVTGQLDHPGVVPVHELGVDREGQIFFTMRLVRGRELGEILRLSREGQEGWNLIRVLGVLQRVCETVAYAHSKGVIHRDLKPSNIMVGRFGEVYVMDWGIARVEGREDHRDLRMRSSDPSSSESQVFVDTPLVTMDGAIIGTPYFMSPEQAKGLADGVTERSDVYAIGCMLYELLTGVLPYEMPGQRRSPQQILANIIQGPPTPARDLTQGTPGEMEAICDKAMARDPTDRYGDVATLAEDLSAFVEGRVVQAYETGAIAELRKWVERNRALAASVAAAVLLAVTGLASTSFVQARGRQAEQAQKRIAEGNLRTAREAQARALSNLEDVLRLSDLQEVKDLLASVDRLWPVHPERIPDYEEWIADARELVARSPTHSRRREELRAAARPLSEEERRADRESHPDYPELEPLEDELAFRRRALAQRSDGVAAELPSVDWSNFPDHASGLRTLAWARVDPARVSMGDEPLGLLLAKRALSLASERERPSIGMTLAQAYFAVGRDEDALEAAFESLAAAPAESKARLEASLISFEEAVAKATSQEGLARESASIQSLEMRLAELDSRLDERRSWFFPSEQSEARWWNNQLTKLIGELEGLSSGLLAEDSVTAAHGWSVPKRLAHARDLEIRFAEGGDYARAWANALPRIRAIYSGLELVPQVGLVPIGIDPRSRLWEFAHLQSGEIAQRDEKGSLVLTDETALVLVLLPGGTFSMGAQADDPTDHNYDPQAKSAERPVHEVTLPPFFFSKYEMTQGQWARLAGRNPAAYNGRGWNYPVEGVSWEDCMELLPDFGLELPLESQWEYGARGGTDTPWWTGEQRESLLTPIAINAADRTALEKGASWPAVHDWPELEDGHVQYAPIGTFAPNPFGLQEIHGNLRELCRDAYHERAYELGWTDPAHVEKTPTKHRVTRGACFSDTVSVGRSARRGVSEQTNAWPGLGLRPVRSISS